MRKVTLVLAVIINSFLFSSCEVNNHYSKEEILPAAKILEKIVFSNFSQKAEMKRKDFNFSGEYTENSRPGGSVNLLVINSYGDIVIQQKKILLEPSGLIETGTITGLEEGNYTIAIENIYSEDFYYNSKEEFFHKSSVDAKYGEYGFQTSIYNKSNIIQSSENSLLKFSGITIEGGDLNLIKSKVHFKVTEGSIDLWKLIHNVYSNRDSRYGSHVGSYTGRYESEWETSENGFSSIEDSLNEEILEDTSLNLEYRINTYGIPEDVRITYYTEYYFVDSEGEILTLSSEEEDVLIKKSENITRFDVDVEELYLDESSAQEFMEYSFETHFEKVTKKEVMFQLASDEAEINTLFSDIIFYNEKSAIIETIKLTESSWIKQADDSYRLVIPFDNEEINSNSYAEYKVFLKLSQSALQLDDEVYISGNFQMKTFSEKSGEKIHFKEIETEIED